MPSDYHALVARLYDISTDFEALNMFENLKKTLPGSHTSKKPAEKEEIYDPIDIDPPGWNKVKASAARSSRTNPNGQPSTRKEDADLIGKRAKWVLKEILEERKDRGACFRCGRKGC